MLSMSVIDMIFPFLNIIQKMEKNCHKKITREKRGGGEGRKKKSAWVSLFKKQT
jgi:pantothenate kinase